MNEHRCWRCNRSLNVEQPPVNEPVIVRCQRCKASNKVQEGEPAKPPFDKPHTTSRQLAIT